MDMMVEAYHFGRPVDSIALTAASAPGDFWGCEMGEKHQGAC